MRRYRTLCAILILLSLVGVGCGISRIAQHSSANPANDDISKLQRGSNPPSETVDGLTISPSQGWAYTNAETTVTPPNPKKVSFTQIKTNVMHSIALGSDNLVYTWGDNSFGQLGNGTSGGSSTRPIRAKTPSGVHFTQVTVGSTFSMALTDDHKIYAWGSNTYGEMGNPAVPLQINQPLPQAIAQGALPTSEHFIQIAAGNGFALALGSDNRIYAWGQNAMGQLGNGLTPSSNLPVVVAQGELPAGEHYVRIANSSLNTALALGSNGKLYTWGANQYGVLGNGSAITRSSTPVQVKLGAAPDDVQFKSMDMGYNHALAIDTNNVLYAWGANESGQLGTGNTTGQRLPVLVNTGALPAGEHFTQVSAGLNHTIALGSDNKVYTWGSNATGQLGDDGGTDQLAPVQINQGELPISTHYTQVTATNFCSFALASNNYVYGWGDNSIGQLGNGSTAITQPTPMETPIIEFTLSDVKFGNTPVPSHTEDPDSGAWKVPVPINSSEQVNVYADYRLNYLTSSGAMTPGEVQTANLHYLYLSFYTVQFDINGGDSQALPDQRVPQDTPTAAHYPKTNPTKEHNWFLGWEDRPGHFWDFTEPITSDMTLKAKWEPYRFTIDPVRGSATGGTAINVTPPAPPEGLRFTQVDGGWYHSLAIASDGSLYAWGKNDFGALGTGDYVSSTHPVRVKTPDNVRFIQVCAGWDISWALTDDGKVYSWGDGRYGMLGTGTDRGSSNVPVEVAIPASAGPITQLGAGAFHCTALDDQGNVYVWGRNNYGQQATGDRIDSNQPHLVASPPDGSHYVQVSSGGYHSLALTSNHDIYGWGRNWEGQLANGDVGRGIVSTSIVKALPGELPAGRHFVKIISGDNHVFAIDDQQQLYGFGWNYYGSLGFPFSSAIGRGSATTPIVIHSPTGAPFDQIAARGQHVLAYSDGVLYSWGGNWSGQLGNGVKGDGIWQWETPASNQGGIERVRQGDLPAGHHFTKLVSSMGQHSLAISDEGLVYTWGDNEYGQLGDGESGTPSNKPEPVKLSQIDHGLQITGVTFDGTPSTTSPPTWNSTKGVWENVTAPDHAPGPATVKIQWTISGQAQDDYPLPFTYDSLPLPAAGATPTRRIGGAAIMSIGTMGGMVLAGYQIANKRRYSNPLRNRQ
ncbi:hypothetical protein KIMH_04400 [Bombiscardovia apis]|uniref:RCC1-like domain-containing protein n=1 Tax=Bombiscardovia apis TaxID=2932182 RepID=A0ABM8BBR7_9BIFI|nr:InlB B-repeat-containing protein [Bombiscardovia apis]BDR54329.1 hypothetical protein KIMH_04400 [Bombiscardovia apis]